MSEPAAVPNPEPPARGKRIGGLLALVALAAVAIGAGWWWTHRKVPALPPVAATLPLQRVLVLPGERNQIRIPQHQPIIAEYPSE